MDCSLETGLTSPCISRYLTPSLPFPASTSGFLFALLKPDSTRYLRLCSSLTCETDIKDEIPVESAPVQGLHDVAHLGGVEAQTSLHVVDRGGHGVHGVHHEHDLGLGLKL